MGSGAFLVEACRQLGDELVEAWHVHKLRADDSAGRGRMLHARRLVAQRCLYGVDKNPMAVDLAKLSLWLATLAKDHPFTFLDHSLRCGDSLVGLTREQIGGFHWDEADRRSKRRIDERGSATRLPSECGPAPSTGSRFSRARDDNPYEQPAQKLDVADEALSLARLDRRLVIAAYFSATKDKDRKKRLDELAPEVRAVHRTKREDRRPPYRLMKCGRYTGGRPAGSSRFTGKSSSRKCSDRRERLGSMRSWAIRRSRAKTH